MDDIATAIQSLPEDRQTGLKYWLIRQQLIAAALGLSTNEWSSQIDWARRHCFDGSYLEAMDELSDGDIVTSSRKKDSLCGESEGAAVSMFTSIAAEDSSGF